MAPGEADGEEDKISVSEAKELCHRNGIRPTLDEHSLLHSFSFNRYKIGKATKTEVSFPSLPYIKKKLESIAELGFMGLAFDADKARAASLAMFNSLFVRADYRM